jgi:DNA-binding NtrC family response regulator
MQTTDETIYASQGCILIVDDLPNWRQVLSEILAADGYEVHATEAFAQALEIVAQKPVDVAILDLRLDDRDFYNVQGVPLLQQIRIISPRTRILMITGFPSAGLVDKIPTVYGVDAFWLKNPIEHQFDINRFTQEIRALVAKSRQH